MSYFDIRTDEQKGTAHQEAGYRFQRTNRDLHNLIDSRFGFRESKIVEHIDDSNRWDWAWKAFGFPQGPLVSPFPIVLRMKATKQLEEFRELQPKARMSRSSLRPP